LFGGFIFLAWLITKPYAPTATTDLFYDGEILDVICAVTAHFGGPMEFPFCRLRNYRDHINCAGPNRNKPPQIISVEWTRLRLGTKDLGFYASKSP
jgi:hypothetical protein